MLIISTQLIYFCKEPDKPGDAVDYLKNTVGGTPEDKKTIDELRTENSELKAKVICFLILLKSENDQYVDKTTTRMREANFKCNFEFLYKYTCVRNKISKKSLFSWLS